MDRPRYLCLIRGGEIVVNDDGNILTLEDTGGRMDRREKLMDNYRITEHPHDYMLRVYDSFDAIPVPDNGEVVDLEGTLDFDD